MVTIKRPNFKKPFLQELKLLFPIFSNFKIVVVLSEDVVSAGRYIADRDFLKEPPSSIEESEAFTTSSTSGYSIIHLKPNAALGTVAHESYHAVCAMMRFIGANEEHEVVAYHLGFLVDKIVEFNLKVAPRFERRKKCLVQNAGTTR